MQRQHPWRLTTHECEQCEIKQGRQCTYNITLKCVREGIVAVEKEYVLHIF